MRKPQRNLRQLGKAVHDYFPVTLAGSYVHSRYRSCIPASRSVFRPLGDIPGMTHFVRLLDLVVHIILFIVRVHDRFS